MASASDIATVRRNVNEPTDAGGYTDIIIGNYVDEEGVAGASATIWTEKAAKYAELVDVSEAGASHKFSDLHKNALSMAAEWAALIFEPTAGAVRVRKIVRD